MIIAAIALGTDVQVKNVAAVHCAIALQGTHGRSIVST